jgi:prevent-host-death family protein
MKEVEAKRYPKSNSRPAFLRQTGAAAASPFVTVRDAKSHRSELLEWVSGDREITITSAGKPKARLVAVQNARVAFSRRAIPKSRCGCSTRCMSPRATSTTARVYAIPITECATLPRNWA